MAEATARASQLAMHYKAIFAKCRPAGGDKTPHPPTPKTCMSLVFDSEMTARFIATWKTARARELLQHMDALREAPRESWQALESRLGKERTGALEQLRRQDPAPVDHAVASMERTLNVHLLRPVQLTDVLVREFNSARIAFLNDCLTVLSGDRPVSALFPEKAEQLPLVELWGDPTSRIAERWREAVEASNCYVNPRTLKKYRGIASDLGCILVRRPVQALTGADLDALMQLWKSRGNIATTIKDKLGILKSLLKPFDANGHLRSLFAAAHVGPPLHRAGRLPFTDQQLRQFTFLVLESDDVSPDDKALLALLLLLSGRLEEVCQLTADDLEEVDYGWIVRIADHRQTGHGNARLKNTCSARRLPLHRGTFPHLDAWLTERIADGGNLFPDMQPNRYGQRGSAASKRLNGLLRTLFDDRRLVLQSTRNTASRIMRRADTDPRVRRRFLGHADVGIHDRHYDPGELLDDHDLGAGSAALAAHLRHILGIEGGPSI